MLKRLRRKKTAKRLWTILAIIIVPAFVFWGASGAIREKSQNTPRGRIFGRQVSSTEYAETFEAARTQAILQFGDNFSQIQQYLNLESQVWQRLVLLYEARRRKVTASDKEVVELIQSYPFFQRKGRFDKRTYAEVLRYVFHTKERAFEEQTRQNIVLSKLYKEVTASLPLTEEEIREEYTKANQQISIYYISAIPDNFTKGLSPSEDELRAYFSRNSLKFRQPLSFNIDYMIMKNAVKVKEAADLLSRKTEFKKVSEQVEAKIEQSGLFTQNDPIPGIGWSPEVLKLLEGLKTGESSPPIQIDNQYCIFQLKEKKEPYIPDFEEIKDKIKEAFVKERGEEIAKERTANCLNKLNELRQAGPKSVDFSKTAKELGLDYGSTEPFKYGSYIEGLGSSDKFWMTARELEEGSFSDIINAPGGLYIIKTKSREPVDEQKFAEEKKEFSEKLLLRKQQEYFNKFTEDLLKKSR